MTASSIAEDTAQQYAVLRPAVDAIIFIGIQGAGKTTFYQERFSNTHTHISLDVLRTRHREMVLVEECVAAGRSFVVDNTNVRAAERAVYIQAARRGGFAVNGYFFDANPRDALRRNLQRTGKQKIPPAGVIGTWKKLEPPRLEEGFDRLYTVTRDDADRFVVREWPHQGGS
jgi:predicted kinase